MKQVLCDICKKPMKQDFEDDLIWTLILKGCQDRGKFKEYSRDLCRTCARKLLKDIPVQ